MSHSIPQRWRKAWYKKVVGYFEIGVHLPRNQVNIGTLWRSAYQLGAAGIFTIGRAYRRQTSDTVSAPFEIPLRTYLTFEDLLENRPAGAVLVAVEMGGTPLAQFVHPERAVYLLGSEDSGLGERILSRCNHVVSIESVAYPSYNLAVAGSLVMYHRLLMELTAPKS